MRVPEMDALSAVQSAEEGHEASAGVILHVWVELKLMASVRVERSEKVRVVRWDG